MIACFVAGAVAQAQVNIGSLNDPHPGAILDISQSEREWGFLLPHVELEDVSKFQLQDLTDDGTVKAAKGMLIYNTSKTTKGAEGIDGQFVWDGAKWLPVGSGAGGLMTLQTVDNWGLSEKPVPYDGSQVIEATVINNGCDVAGEYQFIVISGNATLTPEKNYEPNFELTFENNETSRIRRAVVQVIDPCGKTATFLLYQDEAPCDNKYNVPEVKTLNDADSICLSGAVYAYVDKVIDANDGGREITVAADLDTIDYTWLFNNMIVATGRGATLTQAGTYYVYAGMMGCGTAGSVTVKKNALNEASPAHLLLATNDGVICNGTAIKLRLLNVKSGEETVYWFKNGVPQATHENPLTLNSANDVGSWFAVVVSGDIQDVTEGCSSKPSNTVSVTTSTGLTNLPPIQAFINDQAFGTEEIALCVNSTVRLEIKNYTDYDASRRFYWYLNDMLWGESDGQAIYVVPQDYQTGVISVKLIVDSEHCPITVSTNEMKISYSDAPSQSDIMWNSKVRSDAYICSGNPANLYATAGGEGVEFQWFKDGSTTPIMTVSKKTGTDDVTHQYGVENDLLRASYSVSTPGTYTVRYKNSYGCWSLISNPIVVSNSALPTIEWYVSPTPVIVNGSHLTYQVRATPAATKYEWWAEYATADPVPDTYISITPLGDGSSAMVDYNFDADLICTSYQTGTGDEIAACRAKRGYQVHLFCKAINDCGETTTESVFDVINDCSPTTSVTLSPQTSTSVMLGESVRFQAALNGTGTKFISAYVYLDNAETTRVGDVNNNTDYKDYMWSGLPDGVKIRTIDPLTGYQIDLEVCKSPDVTGSLVPTLSAAKQATVGSRLCLRVWLLFDVDAGGWTDASRINFTTAVTTFALGTHYVLLEGKNDCSDHPLQSELQKVEVAINPDKIAVGPPEGIDYVMFSGQKTCLDVNITEDSGTNSWQGDRLPKNVRPTDLTKNTRTLTYIWNIGGSAATGVKETVQYIYRSSSDIVESIDQSNHNAVLKFNENIVNLATGRTKSNPLQLTLYAIYTVSGTLYKDSVVIKIQDGACGCPAKISATQHKMFRCHVLGANTSYSPFTPREEIYGFYWRFGRKDPSATWSESPNTMNDQSRSDGERTYHFSNQDGTGGSNTDWQMVPNNPCPRGWVVPTITEMAGIAQNNSFSPVGNLSAGSSSGGWQTTYFPMVAMGYRDVGTNGARVVGGTEAHHWSRSSASSANAYNSIKYSVANSWYSDGDSDFSKNYQEIIRCVQDGEAY
jgi:hypothetical protein